MDPKKYNQGKEHESEERSHLRRSAGPTGMWTLIAVAALGIVTATAIAQSEEEPEVANVASPARPQVDTVETVEIEGAGYDLLVYVQEDKTVEDKDAHFYYTPLFFVVTNSEKMLKYHIDDNNVLTLKIRRDSDTYGVEEAVRQRLIRLAKEANPKFTLESGTTPYRLHPLKMSKIVFTSNKLRIQSGGAGGEWKVLTSGPVPMALVERGEINVNFYLNSREEAESFVHDLQDDNDQLLWKYTFAGVSDEVCKAKFEKSGTQSIDLFKKVTGAGGEGKVARHQAATIADKMVRSGNVVARCADIETAEKLMDRLLGRLGDHDTVEVASWKELDKLIVFDVESFKADVETSVKTLRKEVNRKQILEALASAESSARSKASSWGGSADYGVFHADISKDLADTGSQDKSDARKDYKDTLAKMGIHVDWKGNRYIPKSVDVHSIAALDNAWGRTFEIAVALTEREAGNGVILMTQESWENTIDSERERHIEERLANMEAIVERVNETSTVAGYQSSEANQNAKTAYSIAMEAKHVSTRANQAATNAAHIASGARLRADQAHRKDNEAIRVEYCHYELKREKITGFYFYNFLRSDDVAILSGVDVPCGDNEYDVFLSRRSRNDADWIVKIDSLSCEDVRLNVIFLNGNSVGRSGAYNRSIPYWEKRGYNYSSMAVENKLCYTP